ncbi:uncharacterized protein P174DRAFT_442545 [Aspergillus novofumigatus IBT 16806]|uniref:Uncharacterized protein n=1 Tax=Aspergillus novofumigatus (strain IBT 16806) TaxID=1392255 RepID=A0A2I1C4X6_ASPN1|nr:uncharacterized protein P174DRAFT_442545 [Aspergillus novofumigatus IBT 16806]PKX92676.1 hypothetical protein P174DRAFT_442545 [Aspergillus novofumigatus IBT 16806]
MQQFKWQFAQEITRARTTKSQIASKQKDRARWKKARHWRAGEICLKSGLDGGRQQEVIKSRRTSKEQRDQHGTANDHQVDSPGSEQSLG